MTKTPPETMGCCGSNDVRKEVMLVGLDNAGKTTILEKLQNGGVTNNDDEVIAPAATIGFNVERVDYNGLRFNVWDIGGQDATRQLWEHYFQTANAVIFVVDSKDTARLGNYNETHDSNGNSTELDDDNNSVNNNSDSSNKVKNTAQLELERIVKNKIIQERKCPILIFANKQDTYGGGEFVTTTEMGQRLGINQYKSKNAIFIQGASAIKYQGIEEGMNWLVQRVNRKESNAK